MIVSFAQRDAEALFTGYRVRRLIRIEHVIRRKLAQLHSAPTLAFLRAPPGNPLEMLQGDRFGQFSIRVNDKYRICSRWSDGDACDVEIVDYH
jgi:proteic killer suppression protein